MLIRAPVCDGFEVVYIVFVRSWNSEIFTVISGLIGTLAGVFFGQKV